jgi:hypothetical protein
MHQPGLDDPRSRPAAARPRPGPVVGANAPLICPYALPRVAKVLARAGDRAPSTLASDRSDVKNSTTSCWVIGRESDGDFGPPREKHSGTIRNFRQGDDLGRHGDLGVIVAERSVGHLSRADPVNSHKRRRRDRGSRARCGPSACAASSHGGAGRAPARGPAITGRGAAVSDRAVMSARTPATGSLPLAGHERHQVEQGKLEDEHRAHDQRERGEDPGLAQDLQRDLPSGGTGGSPQTDLLGPLRHILRRRARLRPRRSTVTTSHFQRSLQ